MGQQVQVQLALSIEANWVRDKWPESAVRNSRHPDGPALIYSRAEMAAFIQGVKDPQLQYCFSRGILEFTIGVPWRATRGMKCWG